jgi:hypothetical protein
MRTVYYRLGLCLLASLAFCGPVHAWGFGGFRAGGFRAGGFRAGGFGGYHYGGFSSYRDNLGGFRSGGYRDEFSGYRSGLGGYAGGSYDRSLYGARGGSLSVSGSRGAAVGPLGGFAAGGRREVTATGPLGRSFTAGRSYGVARGPLGGVAAGGARWGGAGVRFPTDVGLGRYSALGVARVGPSTVLWSHSYLADRASFVRSDFIGYNAFAGSWYTSHPLAWRPAFWAVTDAVTSAAWIPPAWPTLALFCNIPSAPAYYDYGNTVVYQNNNVYVDGEDIATTAQYAEQAQELAAKGQAAKPPEKTKWQPLGVFALVQGEEKTSNTIFQLAIDQNGTIRGNYYDALMGSTTPVYGSLDKIAQRAAWTIGDNKSTVFETGIYNLTKSETPVLVHFGQDKTQQWLLVRVQQPQGQN